MPSYGSPEFEEKQQLRKQLRIYGLERRIQELENQNNRLRTGIHKKVRRAKAITSKVPPVAPYTVQKYLDQARKRSGDKNSLKRSERIAKHRQWLETLKSSNPCTDCGLFYPAECMDFDHLDGRTQNQPTVSQMVTRQIKRETIEDEMKKCQLVCSNCHRTRTRLRRQKKTDLALKERRLIKAEQIMALYDNHHSP